MLKIYNSRITYLKTNEPLSYSSKIQMLHKNWTSVKGGYCTTNVMRHQHFSQQIFWIYEQKHYIHNQHYVTDIPVHPKHEKFDILEIIAVITARKPSIRSHSILYSEILTNSDALRISGGKLKYRIIMLIFKSTFLHMEDLSRLWNFLTKAYQ